MRTGARGRDLGIGTRGAEGIEDIVDGSECLDVPLRFGGDEVNGPDDAAKVLGGDAVAGPRNQLGIDWIARPFHASLSTASMANLGEVQTRLRGTPHLP